MSDWRVEMINELKCINSKLDKIVGQREHNREHNLKEPAQQKIYKCDKCDFETENRHSFAAHAKKHKGVE